MLTQGRPPLRYHVRLTGVAYEEFARLDREFGMQIVRVYPAEDRERGAVVEGLIPEEEKERLEKERWPFTLIARLLRQEELGQQVSTTNRFAAELERRLGAKH